MEQTVDAIFSGFGLIMIIIGILLLIFWGWSVVWAYNDARRRGKPGWLVALVVLLMIWPVGLVLWLLLRPINQKQ
jgi:antibiotic biosynthesis monooxygenase (ABM) superfamily enzyme